jgi:drug/metabolite transporter (DMT)-like permease
MSKTALVTAISGQDGACLAAVGGDVRSRLSPAGLWLNLALISAAWGSSFLVIKLIGVAVPPFALCALRGFIAAAALLLWLALRGGGGRRRRDTIAGGRSRASMWRNLRHMLVLGTTNGWLASVLTVVAVRRIDTAIVATMLAAVPLFVVVLAHFVFAEERFRLAQSLGVLVGFCGIVLIVGPPAALGGRGSLVGVAAMLLIALCFACGTVYGRLVVASADPTWLACGQQICGAVIGGAISLLTESPERLWPQPSRVWLWLAIVGVLCSALPTALYLRLLTRAASVPSALVAYLQPVWATLLGWAVLGERISAAALFGVGLVVAGIILVTTRGWRPR